MVVGDDGKVGMPELEGGRIDFRILVTSKLVGDEIELGFYRAGELHDITAKIGAEVSLVSAQPQYGCYYMFAGLVFTPLSVAQVAMKVSKMLKNDSIAELMLSRGPRQHCSDATHVSTSTVGCCEPCPTTPDQSGAQRADRDTLAARVGQRCDDLPHVRSCGHSRETQSRKSRVAHIQVARWNALLFSAARGARSHRGADEGEQPHEELG